MSKKIDMTGKIINRWTVLSLSDTKGPRGFLWNCLCECGNTKLVNGFDLRAGHSKSCGCYLSDMVKLRCSKKDSGLNDLLLRYKGSARRKSLPFTLTKEEFIKITSEDCYYCGSAPSTISKKSSDIGIYIYNGIDRKNNLEGYTIENSLPCCNYCNFLKKNADYDAFISHIKQIYKHRIENNENTRLL